MKFKKLSIVIPVYNEINTLGNVVDKVREVALPMVKEIIVVDDFSTDGTRELVKSFDEADIKTIFHQKNQGKGAALRSGFQFATGDIILIQDADLEYDPQDYLKLLQPILDGKADVVFGSRFQGSEAHRVLYYWHSVGNRILTTISNMLTNINLTDMETCYKVFRRGILMRVLLKEDRFGFEPEITAKVARQKCRIFEVGISYNGRCYEDGKKIGWRDGVWAFWCIVKYNLLEK